METAFRKPLENVPLSEDAQAYLREIIINLPQDLAPDRSGYYSLETSEKLAQQASEKLAATLSSRPQPISFEDLRSAWTDILIDYHRNANWNYPTESKKPEKALTEDQKIRRELWPYIWVLIQSTILLKTLVYYFGINASADPSPENTIMLVLALLTSLGTLVFFAWRKSRK